MTDRWTDRLSDYLDDALSPSDRHDLETHLRECPACAEVLADLRVIVERARAIPARDAERGVASDLWPGIEARLRDRPIQEAPREPARARPGHRFSFSLRQLAAAAAAVIAVSALATWFAQDWSRRATLARQAAGGRHMVAVPASSAPVEAALNEIEALKQLLDRRRHLLDPSTLRTIEESLASIEAAVEQARLALEADPDDPYLVAHLEGLTRRQLKLLRRAVGLAEGAP